MAAIMASSASAVVLKSDPICNSAGCTQYLHPKADDGWKKDYFVPNFGRDHDINTSMNSLDVAQKQLNHTWVFPKGIDKKVVTYQTDYPLDEDMISSIKNIESSEKMLDHKWNVKEVFKN